jgi:hypothetical protein
LRRIADSFVDVIRGYHARRLLRTRVEEAIARGVYVSGYTEDEFRNLGRGRRGRLPIMSEPMMHENWMDTKRPNTNGIMMATGWDIKVRFLCLMFGSWMKANDIVDLLRFYLRNEPFPT